MINLKQNTKDKGIDWAFLLFLVGSTYVKLYVKIAAIIFYFLYQWSKKYEFRKLNRLNKFYFSIILVGGLSSAIGDCFSVPGYAFGFLFGSFQWLAAGSISYLVYIAAVNIPAVKYHNALKYFFVINAIVSFINLFYLTITAGGLPYWLTGQQYGVSTGDYINGLLGDTSFANAAVSSLGIVYFLFYRQYGMLFICTITMLLCTSNVTLVFLFLLLFVIIVLNKNVRKPAFFVLLFCLVIYPVLSPQNLKYMNVVYARESGGDRALGREELPQIERHVAITPSLGLSVLQIEEADGEFRQSDLRGAMKANVMYAHYEEYAKPFIAPAEFRQNIDKFRIRLRGVRINVSGELDKVKTLAEDSLSKRQFVSLDPYVLQNVMTRWYNFSPATAAPQLTALPGKIYTGIQTTYFLRSSIKNFFLGAGMGNFSSKLAVKMTGLGIQGSYPAGYNYISADFLQYHFFTILYYLSQHAAEHSILNTPNSIYNQLAGEYGLIGLLLFILLYLGYLIRHWNNLRYGRYLLLLALLFFNMEYWFETLSLTIIFEAMIFKEIINNTANAEQ